MSGERMSAIRGTTAALSELEEKLLHLKNLTEANQFMLEVLKDQGERLQEIDGDTARSMLRAQARSRFSPTKGKTPKPEVLAILEQTLGTQQSAQIIPFPKRN